jgi:taurine dioxygenase
MPAFRVDKLAHALGAEVSGVDLSRPLPAAAFGEIREAWLDRLVLRFRGQKLTDPQLLAFSRLFGELDPPGPNPYGRPVLAEHPEVNVISNIKQDGVPIGGLGDGEAIWHADMTYVDTPPMAAMLYALEVPPSGGDTYWASLVLAYETLPAELRQRIEGRSAVHDATYNSAGHLRKGYQELSDPRQAPGARHPLVRAHPETGRKCLFLGRRRNSSIVGLEPAESERLLDALWAHATQPQFTFRQQWRAGDVLVWDNRCTVHRRDAFDPSARRLMHRTQIKEGQAALQPGGGSPRFSSG